MLQFNLPPDKPDSQAELRDAVLALVDKCQAASLTDGPANDTSSLLPSTRRVDPKEAKSQLLTLRDKTLPDAKASVEAITKRIVADTKSLVIPELAEAERMQNAAGTIKARLFALELYAGITEDSIQLRDGKPAPMETPVTIRQCIRYMDEECLFDWNGGGMDWTRLDDFNRWIRRPEVMDRLLPEPRCVVAFQVRRNEKDYGPIRSIAEIFSRLDDNEKNRRTYLYIRNGERLSFLDVPHDFQPRLIPYRDELGSPLVEKSYDWSKREDVEVVITKDDIEFDKFMAERRAAMMDYNRTVFLIQGLLDRSKVFEPHPPINLSDGEVCERWLKIVRDEEDALPAHGVPTYQEYRDRLNASLKLGDTVYAAWSEPKPYRDRMYNEDRTACYSGMYEVTQISRDRKKVRVSWPWGTRWGWSKKSWRGRYDHGEWGEWPVDRKRHKVLPIESVLNANAYTPGDYKQFLCDAALKAQYMKWAPPMLSCEKWHRQQREAKAKT